MVRADALDEGSENEERLVHPLYIVWRNKRSLPRATAVP
jgi:hypothetical protein